MNTSHRRTTPPQRRPDAWEWRRQRAWELPQHGWWQKDSAAAVGVSCAAVGQWLKRRREGGAAARRTRPQPGPPPRLTAGQRAQLPGRLARGAEASGFGGDVWTARRVAEVIWRTCGVRDHPEPVSRLWRPAGWSRQPPVQRAPQRHEEASQRGSSARWPALRNRRTRQVARSSG